MLVTHPYTLVGKGYHTNWIVADISIPVVSWKNIECCAWYLFGNWVCAANQGLGTPYGMWLGLVIT